MIDIALLSGMVVAKEIGPTHHIEILFREMELLGVLELDRKGFLVAEEIKADEIVPGEKKDLVFADGAQLKNLLPDGQSDGFVIHEHGQLIGDALVHEGWFRQLCDGDGPNLLLQLAWPT